MDKIKINTLGPLEEPSLVEKVIGEAQVIIRPSIPYEEMLDMIQWCIDFTINDRPFLSAPLRRIIKDFAILKFYTNFDFSFMDTVHELKDIYGEYDLLKRYAVVEAVLEVVDPAQLKFFNETLDETLTSILAYRNSAQGIVDSISDAAKDVNKDVEGALAMVDDPEKMEKIAKIMQFAESAQ